MKTITSVVEQLIKHQPYTEDALMRKIINYSALAEDFKPNRLEAVKETAAKFIEKRSGDRIGLLVFAGETFIQCPLVKQGLLGSQLEFR